MKVPGFEFQDHTADIQVRSWGSTLEEAFSQTAYSLMTIITPHLEKVEPQIDKFVSIEAVLFDFLSEFLYIFDVEELVFNTIDVFYIKNINSQYFLKVFLKGEKFNINKHSIGTEVKAITYSFMEIKEDEEYVEIQIVFDI